MSTRDPEVVDRERLLLEVHEVAERVVGARTNDRRLVEDLAQETVARVAEALPRLTDDALVPYAVVTARNLYFANVRQEERRATQAHRLIDRGEPERPEDRVLARERRYVLEVALESLDEAERRTVLAHEVGDVGTQRLAAEEGSSPGAVAVRLARIRAKLRVEYLVSYRHVELPTDRCRSILVALSAGDQRRQRELRAGDHLLRCPTCSGLTEVLLRRDPALAAWWPIPLLPSAASLSWKSLKAHPAGAVTVAAGVAVGGALLASREPSPPVAAAAPATVAVTTASTTAAPTSSIEVDGQPVLPFETPADVSRHIGRPVDVNGAEVLSVEADEGFWIGLDDGQRLWVQLRTPGESPVDVRAGGLVTFRGRFVGHGPDLAGAVGVDEAEGADLLTQEGAHIEVAGADVRLSGS